MLEEALGIVDLQVGGCEWVYVGTGEQARCGASLRPAPFPARTAATYPCKGACPAPLAATLHPCVGCGATSQRH